MNAAALDDTQRRRLRWRARRGLLENDVILSRFLDRYESTLSERDAAALTQLLALGDNDLLDLLLARAEPTGETDSPPVHNMLLRLRAA